LDLDVCTTSLKERQWIFSCWWVSGSIRQHQIWNDEKSTWMFVVIFLHLSRHFHSYFIYDLSYLNSYEVFYRHENTQKRSSRMYEIHLLEKIYWNIARLQCETLDYGYEEG
jgi:hypothetical protein